LIVSNEPENGLGDYDGLVSQDRFAEFSQPKSNVLKNITQWYNGYSRD
jgi:hypothetical protein